MKQKEFSCKGFLPGIVSLPKQEEISNIELKNKITIKKSGFKETLKSIPDKTIDLILTDPPYAISKKTGFNSVKNGVKRLAVSMDFGLWDRQEIDLDTLASESFRVLKKGGAIIVWYDLWKITNLSSALKKAQFRILRTLIWQKTNPVPLNSKVSYLSNSREIAVMGVKEGKPVFNSEYDNGIYHYPIPKHNGKRIHPTQKPLDLFIEIIEKHTKKESMVCDPFLGSGTTAVACLRTNRHFIGGDIDPGYISKARIRVKGEQV